MQPRKFREAESVSRKAEMAPNKMRKFLVLMEGSEGSSGSLKVLY
jgi:hypothetical protein